MFDMDAILRSYYTDEVAIDADIRKTLHNARVANEGRLENGLAKAGRKKPKRHQPQGGYAMKTVVQQPESKYDVDNGAVFEPSALMKTNGVEMTPLEVRQMVCDALQDEKFKTKPVVRTHCVRVQYNEGYWVDVPVYRELLNPLNNAPYLELASATWKISTPAAVTAWFRKLEVTRSPDAGGSGDPQFRRIVAYVKGLPKQRKTWTWPTGFMMSVLVSECFHADARDDISLRKTLDAIFGRLSRSTEILHPILTRERLDKGTGGDKDPRCVAMHAKLGELLPNFAITDRHDCTAEDAARAWDALYGVTYFKDHLPPNTPKALAAVSTPVIGKFERGDGGRYG